MPAVEPDEIYTKPPVNRLERTFSLETSPVANSFFLDNTRISMIMGPVGCLAADSLVVTVRGLVRIDSLIAGDLVLSLNGKSNRFELSPTTGGFQKGEARLYRVSTQQGEFVAAGHHRVLCADGKYLRVSELAPGQSVHRYSCDQSATTVGAFPLSSPPDVPRWWRTLADWKDRCVTSVRQYGQPLLSPSASCQDGPPSPGDVQRDVDDRSSPSAQPHTHQGQRDGRLGTGGYPAQASLPGLTEDSRAASEPSLRTGALPRGSLLSRVKSVCRRITALFLPCSYRSSLSKGVIISVERLEEKQAYWDCQVANNNNYVTADGSIHHNSGKSVATMQKIIRKAGEQEPNPQGIRRTRWAVVRNTYAQLEDTTIKTWMAWFPAPHWGRFKIARNEYSMKWQMSDGTVVECEILFRALDRPDQVDNLLSAEYTGAWFNEARHIDKTIFDVMDTRIGRYPDPNDSECTWLGTFMDTNPPDEDNWIYVLFEEIRPRNAKAFYQPSGLSPEAENINNLPENYYQDIIETKDEYYIHVYVEGKYGYLRTGKPVYPEYNDTIHCTPGVQAIPGMPLYLGLDFGLTPACVICQMTVDGRLLVLDEVTSTRSGIKQFIDAVKPYLAQEFPNHHVEAWVCDPAGGQAGQADMTSPFDVMMTEGIYPLEGIQNPELRVEAVKQLLNRMVDGQPAILISPHAKMLRKGFTGHYQYRRMLVSKERYTDKPDKNEASHVHDALQYLATHLFGTYGSMADNFKAPKVVGISARGH